MSKKKTNSSDRTSTSRATRETRTRRAPAKKTASGARKRTPAKKLVTKKASASPKLPGFPKSLGEISYVTRTRTIVERRQKRAARLRADTRRELVGVLRDMQSDAEAQIEQARSELSGRARSLLDRARSTRIGTEVEQVPDRALRVADDWLGRVGLVRKAAVAA